MGISSIIENATSIQMEKFNERFGAFVPNSFRETFEGGEPMLTNGKPEQKEMRLIVDRDITDNAIEGIFITIQDAIDDAYVNYLN
jgi:hypothetical protein